MRSEIKELDEELNKQGRKRIDKSKISEIVDRIDEENKKFTEKNDIILDGFIEKERKRIVLEDNQKIYDDKEDKNKNEENDDETDIEIDIEQFSIINRTKNICVKLFNCLLPFKADIKYIKSKYNTTVLLIFRIYRFIYLMSIFSAIIFLGLFVWHIIKNKNNLKQLCKFGFPCLFFISSFTDEEALSVSISYGVFLLFYIICTLSYYFVISSEQEEQEIYFQNNKNVIATSYLVSSWNFNYKTEIESKKTKNAIHTELKNYADEFIKKLEGNKENKCYNALALTLSHIVFVIFVVIYIFVFFILFYVRDIIRQKDVIKNKLSMMDIISDFVTYALFAIIIHLFIGITGIFPKCERWRIQRNENLSEGIKKIIIAFIGIIIIIFFQSFYTLMDNDKKFLPFLQPESYSLFGCPGKWIDARRNTSLYKTAIDDGDYVISSKKSFARCRDEQVGFDFFIIFIVYYIFFYLDEVFKCCFRCCYDDPPSFSPILSLIDVFSMMILYTITIFFFPILGIFSPLLMYWAYRFQFRLLKRKGSYSFKETGIKKRNNNKFVLITFLIFNIGLILSFGYFYLLSFPHYYNATCYSSADASVPSILIYDKTNWCGPVKSRIRLSGILSDKIKETIFIGWLIKLFREAPFIIILIALIFIILIYRKYNPDSRYYEYLVKRQLELGKTFHTFYEQISKRDVLTLNLLNLTKQKVK